MVIRSNTLSEAKETNNLTGWKKNEVTSFSASDVDDPTIPMKIMLTSPSGYIRSSTISDWEWMFEAFDKAIAERGWDDAMTFLFLYGK